MSNFSFLHAADLHLGSPFVGLSSRDEQLARRFAAASREAFTDLVNTAIEKHVAFVVIAGDVYDGEWRDNSIGLFFNREVARLQRENIRVFVIKGNHDAESIVTKTISFPENVHQFPSTKATTVKIESLKVALHGRSFADRVVDENYAISYPDPVTGWFNIGILHTSCDGRPLHAPYAPCSVQDLVRRGYQYWALGHVHEYEEISRDPWIVFPGNLQGRNIRESGAKGAVLINVSDSVVTVVQRLVLDKARWASVSLDIGVAADEVTMLRQIEDAIRLISADAADRPIAVRVQLRGATPLHHRLSTDLARLTDEVQAAAHRCHENIWIERFVLATEEPRAPRGTDLTAALDPSALLDGLVSQAELRAKASDLRATIVGKLPGGVGADGDFRSEELDALLGEARALVLGRLERRTPV